MHTSASSAATPPPHWQRRMALLGLGAIGAATALYTAAASDDAAATPAAAAPASLLRGISPVQCSSSGQWPPPLLSHSQVNASLSSPMESITPVGRGVVSEYHVNQYAANPVIEDTLAVIPAVACPPGGLLLGVFDGHSGKDASRWCSEELLPYLQYYRWSNRTDSLIHKRVFLEADHAFLEMALRDKRMAAGLSGACVNVSHIYGKSVRTANAGDCRTIIGRRISNSDSFQAVELTTDHQIDTNPLERERLLRDHPDEEDIIRHNRVKGRLQPTRGFGDGFYKRREFYQARHLSKPYAHWTPPYTTAEPDITDYELQAGDEFMIMASDGLFQELHSQQVVEFVGEWMREQRAEKERQQSLTSRAFGTPKPGYTPNASTYLIRSALTAASEARFGRRRKSQENLSLVLQLPLDKKRNFHDDVTVVVVFFDQKANFPPDGPTTNSAPEGPPVPPTLSRALSLHLKAPSTALQKPLPSNGGITPIKIAPRQEQYGNNATNNEQQATHIKSNL